MTGEQSKRLLKEKDIENSINTNFTEYLILCTQSHSRKDSFEEHMQY